MPRKKQQWSIGDFFTIPLNDETWTCGQIVGREKDALNSVVCVFFEGPRFEQESDIDIEADLLDRGVFALLFVTRDLLDNHRWKVIGDRTPLEYGQTKLIETARENRYIGTSIQGSGVTEKFCNAYYGLHPWDKWHDPEYLDGLLIDPSKKPDPSQLIFKADSPDE